MIAIAKARTPMTHPIASDLRAWWDGETSDWDAEVTGSSPKLSGELWERMPEIDSKVVARSSGIFEKHFGIPLDVRLIRRGGYSSVEDMVEDLVPKMQAKLKKPAGGAKKP